MARAGDAQGTRGGRASLQSSVQGHTNTRGGEIPLHPAPCEHQGTPGPGARVTLAVPPPWCGTGEAPPRFLLCHGSHQTLPAAVSTSVCTRMAINVWLLLRHGGGGGLWLSPHMIVDIHTCGCGHIQGWQCLCPHTRVSVFTHVCSHSHTHTEPWLYTHVSRLTNTCGHVYTHAWLFSYS